MPIVAVVEGVKIVFYANEHPPAHFHAVIAEHRVVVDIVSIRIVEGSLPVAKRKDSFPGRYLIRTLCWNVSLRRLRTTNWSRSSEEAA